MFNAATAGQKTYLIATAAGTIFALGGYLIPGNGIAGSPGALLATIGSAALLISGVLLCRADLPRWMRVTLLLLTVIGLLLTAFASYLLMHWLLLAAISVAALALGSFVMSPNKAELS